MKKLFFVVIALVAFMVSCDKKHNLAGAEFSNPNLMIDGADSMLVDFKHQLDYMCDSIREEMYAEAEKELGRKLTDEEVADIDSQLQVKFDEGYNDTRHSIDSLAQNVKVSCVVTFKDDQHMAIRMITESENDKSDDHYEGDYQVFDGYVILKYDKYRDSLVISPDGKYLFGVLMEDTYKSTLTRTK